MIANVANTQTMELTSSWLQSIDDLNVPVFILRRSYRRTGAVVADTPGESRGEMGYQRVDVTADDTNDR